MSTAKEKRELTKLLKKKLGDRIPVELLTDLGYKELVDEMADGVPSPTFAEVLAQKIMRLAIDPKKSNQWAAELIFDRIEGKAVQVQGQTDNGRNIRERLDDISSKHINEAIARHGKAKSDGGDKLEIESDRPVANPLMDLPQERNRGS